MIPIRKGPPPPLLQRHAIAWRDAFLEAADRWGGYGFLPQSEAEPLKHYKRAPIIEALFVESHGKCAYCEAKVAAEQREAEHFLPKPHHLALAFCWSNLLAVCSTCNAAKANVDVALLPIVNPSRMDPSRYLTYRQAKIVSHPQSPDPALGQRTIELLQLNREDLRVARAARLVDLQAAGAAGRSEACNDRAPFAGLARAYSTSGLG